MLTKIVKRDGREIAFVPEKITRAIYLAASHAAEKDGVHADYSIAEGLTQQVIGYLSGKYHNQIPSVEQVQDAVVKVLIENGHAKTSEAYIVYREQRSQVRNMKTRLMRSIEEITFSDSDTADIKRENANIDGNTAMGTMLQYGSAVSKEFCLHTLLNPKHARLHEEGDIHIHDMDFMNMGTLTCCQIDLEQLFTGGFSTGHGHLREPQDIYSYAALAAIAIQSNQNDQHGGQSVPAFDYYLAPGVAKTFKRQFIDNLNKVGQFTVDPSFDAKALILDHDAHYPIKIDQDEEAMRALQQRLCKTYGIDAQTADKMMAFAYEHALQESEKRTYQAMESFIHNLNTMHSRAGAQVPFSSINFGTDTTSEGRMVTRNVLLAQEAGLGNGETPIFPILIFKVKEGVNFNEEDPNYDLFKLACRVSAKRLFPNFSFLDAPFNKQYYQKGNVHSEATYMGCRTRVVGNVVGANEVQGRGNLSFTSINLVRLGLEYGSLLNGAFDEAGFFAALDTRIDAVIDQLLERFEVQASKKVKNFPFLMGQGVWKGAEGLDWNDSLREVIKSGTLTIGFIGLAECLTAAIQAHHGESEEAQQLGLKIIAHMRRRMDLAAEQYGLNFSLIATPAEGLSGRFTRMDRKRFGSIPGVTDRDFYTNSFHVPVYYSISAFEKIQREAPYHNLTNAGHISYIEMDGDPAKNMRAFETIVRAMKEAGIGYGSINHPLDRDPVCGYSGVIVGDTCPKCGRNEQEGMVRFERIRRITGYLVGTLDRFNNAKQAEESQRVKHGI
ncbi:MAG: anaerobic ribonucleoside triphosphate reductase [Erysipelotrichaceae bacterium]